MADPSSQKNRPIAISLIKDGSPAATHELVVRPEDLTITEPQRVTVYNTLGGAYVDAFGRGIGQITLSGVTGWRGGPDEDGAAKFAALRDTVLSWSKAREALAKAAMSPDGVELAFVDSLDELAFAVAPMEFTLRRNKQRPLLMQFHIRLALIKDLADSGGTFDSILAGISGTGRASATIDSLLGSIGDQGALSGKLKGLRGTLGSLATVGSKFLAVSAGVLQKVIAGVSAVTGAIGSALRPLYDLALDMQRAGRNIFGAISALSSLPQQVRNLFSSITGAFTNAWCSLMNGFNSLRDMFDTSGLLGSSNCSSTGGGAPRSRYASTNPFDDYRDGDRSPASSRPGPAAPIRPASATFPAPTSARSSSTLRSAAKLDVLSSPLTASRASDLLSSILEGVAA